MGQEHHQKPKEISMHVGEQLEQKGYQFVLIHHMTFDVKFDPWRKARLVARGNQIF